MPEKYIILINNNKLNNILIFDSLNTAMTYGNNRYNNEDWFIIKLNSVFKSFKKKSKL